MPPMPCWLPHWHVSNGQCKTNKFMKNVFTILLLLGCLSVSNAQKITNEFFTLHNIIRGDSTYNTPDKQVELIKNTGFDGIEINQVENFESMKTNPAMARRAKFLARFFFSCLKKSLKPAFP